MKIPKTLDDLTTREKYDPNDRSPVLLNCHIGHRKLLCVTIDFLTQCENNGISPDDSFIIYIGSAPGIHLNIVAELYPNTKWLLYDKNNFLITHNIHLFTLKNEYFFDETTKEAVELFKASGKKNFLYMSDLRISPSCEMVVNDMLSQERWLLNMRCNACCLKFRLPYADFIKDNKFEYIDGKIHLQTYAPKRSTETRLISFNPYNKKTYDIEEYEEKLYYFNTVLRSKNYKYKKSENYLFYNQYDDVREFQILYDCGKKEITTLYDYINVVYNKYKILNNVECKLMMFIKRMINIHKDKDIIENVQSIIDKINKTMKSKNRRQFKNLRITIDNYYIKKKDGEFYINYDNIKKLAHNENRKTKKDQQSD